ncbi:C39 family peptidase [Alicyclobacillus sp. SO9]|uniref:C39 family peptidase n=1 Tax=Alicyclobacillus sp. SO9 TaxID=2665646 RepID=UPI0018E83440|nr:C39 family peptidase [Alicyclobacillus sp. SO9]QQE78469.1 C39 family peptidase [Alicyclobacillus sp. SO9]
MRDRKRKQQQHKRKVGYKIPPNARKVPNKRTRRLAAATLVLAVLGGSTTAAWIIQKVSHYNVYSTSASGPRNSTSSSSSVNQTRGASNLGQTPSSAKGQIGSGATVKAKDGDSSNHYENHVPSKHDIVQKMMKHSLPSHALIHVPAISQLPQLRNGCEVTSLAMLLTFEKHPVSKLTLAKEEPQDKTPLVRKNKKWISWGNPNVGFVGSVSGKKNLGYGIYHGPLTKLVNKILPGRGLDLTGMSFKNLEAIVANGTPVEVWDTTSFKPTDSWVSWKSPEGTVKATFFEHAVLLVGYNKHYVYINNPLKGGVAAEKVPIGPFIKAWDQLGKQAMTVAPEKFKD